MARPCLRPEGIRMTTPKAPEVLKAEALTLIRQWRSADKIATVNKGDFAAKKLEYKYRKHLRTAADNLSEVQS